MEKYTLTKSIAASSPQRCISLAAIPRRALVHAHPLPGSRINWISSIIATSSTIKYNDKIVT